MVRAVPVGLVLLAAGCTPHVRPPAEVAGRAPALELLGVQIVPRPGAGDPLRSARFGGISGITFDPSTGELLGISDDDSDSRVFIFTVSKPPEPFAVRLKAYFPLPAGPGAASQLDPEGIAMTADGRLFVASEGLGNREPRVPPGIFEYSRHVAYVGTVPIPRRFAPPATGPLTRGVRHNTGFESLALSTDGRRLFTGSESALAQDGELATPEHGALARILEVAIDGSSGASREFAYPVDRLPRPDFTPGFFVTGLVELLAVDATTLLALERSYVEERGGARTQMRIRLFQVSLEGATDISALESVTGPRSVTPVRKTLLVDLADVRGLPPELAGLDNFEGLAFGPPLPDGSRTLLMVSDDNFSEKQHTAFLLFRWRREYVRRLPPPAAAGIE